MPGYLSSDSETSTVSIESGRVTVTGRLCFSYSVDGATREERETYVATMARRGWKIGVQLRRGQELELFSFEGRSGDVILTPNSQVTAELDRAFPCEGGAIHWVGLLPPKGVERRYTWRDGDVLTICYVFTLVVTDPRCLPQALLLALTYEDEQFARHYLLHVVLITDLAGAQTRTSAVVDVGARRIVRPRLPRSSSRAAVGKAPAKKPASTKKPPKRRRR
jgi:hypothetical protein